MYICYKTTGIKRFDKALRKLDYHLSLKGSSISTRRLYANELHKFIVKFNKLPEELSAEEIIEFYMEYKTVHGIKYPSLKMRMYAMRYYLDNIANRLDLFTKIPIPRTRYYEMEVLTTGEISTILKSCINIRERLIVQMLYETGMRISELIKLNIDDIDFTTKTIIIRESKNGVNRSVTFGSRLESTLRKYLNQNISLFSQSLITRKYHPFISISSTGIRYILNRIVARTNIKKRVNVHALRHAFAVHYLNFGGTIYKLQRLLGHKFISTTIHYLEFASLKEGKDISILDTLSTLQYKHNHYAQSA